MNDPNVQHSTQNNILEQGKVAEQDMLWFLKKLKLHTELVLEISD